MLPAQREKLLHAIIFFSEKTRACHKLKVFKLLHLFDFRVYRESGKSPTGLGYYAWPMGPVPPQLYKEFDDPDPDMQVALLITKASDTDADFTDRRLVIRPRIPFNEDLFTQRELNALEEIAETYLTATGRQMTDVTHLPGQPWHQVYEVQKKHQAPIPYSLALDSKPGSITKEQADEIEEEAREAAALFG